MKPTKYSFAVAGGAVLLLGTLWFTLHGVPALQLGQSGTLSYDNGGNFILPSNYRQWTFLSAGIDMTYGPTAAVNTGHSVFDNVFVNPDAYRYFLATGTWPDKTLMIAEARSAETNVSINRGGHSQGGVTGVEIHLKDVSRFPSDKWAFFDVKTSGVGTLMPTTADCYSCHREHAAVDTTFVQFYPTLLQVAVEKGTLSPAYLKDQAAAKPANKAD